MSTLARFLLDGRTALITGAAGHLGSAMARAFAEAGAHVILNGRRPGPLETFRDELTAKGLTASLAPFDIMDGPARDKALASVARLDVLVNNAYTGRPGTIASADANDFPRAFASGVEAAFACVRAALPALRTAAAAVGQASVINVSSMYGHVSPDPALYGASGLNSPPWYGAAKGGLLQLTRYLACHLASERIRVNALSPGPFPRPEIRGERPDFVARLEGKTPLARIGEAHEIAGPALFLASDAASYVTGVNLPVDGGWTAW